MEKTTIVADGIEGLQVTGASVEDATVLALALEQRLERECPRRKARTLGTGDAVCFLTRAIAYLASPVESGGALLTLELRVAGGTVANSYGYPAEADRMIVRAVPGVGIQAFWYRGHCGSTSVAEHLLHPVLGARSASRLAKPLGWRTTRGASAACGERERSSHFKPTGSRVVRLVDGSFAAAVTYSPTDTAVEGPDWRAQLELVEAAGLLAAEGA